MASSLSPTLTSMPTTRRSLLLLLKKLGEAGADRLAGELGITVSAVRQHLSGLMAAGLVGSRTERGGPGRPPLRFSLAASGEALFPRTYSELTNELLDYVQDEDPAMVDRVFERRRRRRVEQAKDRLARAGTFDRRVKELTAILDADGYLADVQRRRDGTYLVTEHNCAILGVAQRYGLACSTELEFLREALPDATVERVAHKLGGAHVCAYEIRRVRLREGSGAGRRTRASGSVAPPPRGRRTPAAAGRRSLPA